MADDNSTEGARQVVVFSVAGERHALPIDVVQEVVRYKPPQRVSAEVPALVGVIGLRGRIIPVYDLSVQLSLHNDAAGDTLSRKVLVVRTDDGLAGLIVDDVERVMTIAAARLHPPPEGSSPSVGGVGDVPGGLAVVLDPARLMQEMHREVDVLASAEMEIEQ